jgi:hypothetical protein
MNASEIAAAISALSQLVLFIQKARATSKQTGELTAEQDAEFDAKMEAMFAKPHWQIDP